MIKHMVTFYRFSTTKTNYHPKREGNCHPNKDLFWAVHSVAQVFTLRSSIHPRHSLKSVRQFLCLHWSVQRTNHNLSIDSQRLQEVSSNVILDDQDNSGRTCRFHQWPHVPLAKPSVVDVEAPIVILPSFWIFGVVYSHRTTTIAVVTSVGRATQALDDGAHHQAQLPEESHHPNDPPGLRAAGMVGSG